MRKGGAKLVNSGEKQRKSRVKQKKGGEDKRKIGEDKRKIGVKLGNIYKLLYESNYDKENIRK